MKCLDCQGTGLESENKVCLNCNGLGKLGSDEMTNSNVNVEVVEPIVEVADEKKNSVGEESSNAVEAEEISHNATEEEIKLNNLEEVLTPGDEIKIPVEDNK